MDDNKGGTSSDAREELRDQLNVLGKAAGELLEQLVKIPPMLAQIPLQVMPEEASGHARNAVREGFEAVRTLLDSMARGIEQVISDTKAASANSSASASSTETETKSEEAPTWDSSSDNGNTRRIDIDEADGYGGHDTTRLDND